MYGDYFNKKPLPPLSLQGVDTFLEMQNLLSPNNIPIFSRKRGLREIIPAPTDVFCDYTISKVIRRQVRQGRKQHFKSFFTD